VRARAVLLATGGGPTMYRIAAPSLEKSEDGLALAWRAGATMRDMEMVQFHPTGLLAGGGRVTGAVLEEGLRGAGGYLYNRDGQRFMARYDPERMERSTRDVVARSSYMEIEAGRGGPQDGVFIDVSHLGADVVRRAFPGMCQRVSEIGSDLARGPVEVSPTAHFHMGGVAVDGRCRSTLPGLYVAGEDAGGVHGANRLGGNGVAESTVFGRLAGDVLGEEVPGLPAPDVPDALFEALAAPHVAYWRQGGGPPAHVLLAELKALMWKRCGLVRDEAGLRACQAALADLRRRAQAVSLVGPKEYSLGWADALNLVNLIDVSELITLAALERRESRGSHYRSDHPERDDGAWLLSLHMRREGAGASSLWRQPVRFPRLHPDSGKEAM
jgi:succinate dehydrogenase/fumarate reductase flavoprotein subunit